MMMWKQIRLNRIINRKSSRLVTVATEYTISSSWPLIKEYDQADVEGKPDAITMMKGIGEKCYPPYAGIVPLVM